MKRSVTIECISGLIAILFVYAGISKLLDYSTFRLQLMQSPFISGYAAIIGLLIPVIEILTTLMLSFSRFRLIALYASLFLLTTFTAYLTAMLQFSYYIPCSCGGVLASLSWNEHIVLNIFFIVLTLTAIHLTAIENNSLKFKTRQA